MAEKGRSGRGDREREDRDGRRGEIDRPDAGGGGEDVGHRADGREGEAGGQEVGRGQANDGQGAHIQDAGGRDSGDAGGERPKWEPSAEPPDGVDVLVWRLAYQLYSEHRAHTDNFCVACRHFWPCSVRRLAESALTNALDPGGRRHNGEPGPERD